MWSLKEAAVLDKGGKEHAADAIAERLKNRRVQVQGLMQVQEQA